MSYDHATELESHLPIDSKLTFLVKELGRWAAKNPKLRPLHEEFTYALAQLKEKKS